MLSAQSPTAIGEQPQQSRGFGSHINWQAIGAAIYRNRWPVPAIIGAALLLGLLSILLLRPVYRATATVQIDQQVAKVLGTEDSDEFQIRGETDRFLETQQDILRSRDLAEKVVDQLRITGNKDMLQALRIGADEVAQEKPAAVRDMAVDALQEAMSVSLPRLSRVAQISVDSRSAAISARLANGYVDAFINNNLQRKFDQSAYSRKFLQDQLTQTRGRLEESERVMVNFARASGLIEVDPALKTGLGAVTGQSQSLVMADLVELNDTLGDAKAGRIAAEGQWQQAQATPLMSLPEVLANPAVQSLTTALATARVEYQELQGRMKGDHPTLQQKAAMIAMLEKELGTQARSVRDSIQNRYLVASRREAALGTAVGGLKGATLAERDRSIQYNILRREVDTNRELYDALLQRFKEVSAEAGIATNNLSVVDRAVTPTQPTWPRPLLNMGIALILGFAGAGAWIVGREQFSDTVRSPDDVESRAGLKLLGVTPLVPAGSSPAEQLRDPKSQFSEAIHSFRTALELATPNGLPRSLAFTSTRPSEGKTTLTYSLAREFARTGKRAIVIDADMRAPTLHMLCGVQNKIGLAQILAQQSSLDDAILKTDTENLNVIVSGRLPPDPTLLLNGANLTGLIAALRARYDLILIDCPPILGLADALQIGSNTDAMVMVIEAKGTRFGNLRTSLARVRAGRVNLLGAVLSKFDAKRFGYGDYYGYSYSHYGTE